MFFASISHGVELRSVNVVKSNLPHPMILHQEECAIFPSRELFGFNICHGCKIVDHIFILLECMFSIIYAIIDTDLKNVIPKTVLNHMFMTLGGIHFVLLVPPLVISVFSVRSSLCVNHL